MATLTKADAARQLGISRTTLYKLIDQGKLSTTPEGLIDTAELVRVMSTVNVHDERSRTPLDIKAMDASISGSERRERPVYVSSEQEGQTSSERQLTSTYRDLVDILREQIQGLRDELHEARAERQAARDREALLLRMVEQMQHRYDRLLEAPRSAPSPRSSPGPRPKPRPAAPSEDPRGDMRRRIVALLQDYPAGLTPAEMRPLLGVDKRLADTCLGMLRYGLVQRVGRGRYVGAETRKAGLSC